MKRYNATCPICGKINKNVYLDETDGWMECEGCYTKVRTRGSSTTIKVPVFTSEQLTKLVKDGKFAAGQY